MRTIIPLILLSSSAFGAELTLSKEQGYVVPDGKVWIVKDAPVVDCRVCTADVYLRDELNNIQISGVTFSGELNFSFNNENNGEIRMYPGTEVWLGDSRRLLKISEEDL
ncbi:hypothetical protein Misp06_00030 [Microbulbifer sp. NBRC 101763]|uniref:hypothetical protein n=1 Tax=unclassified Microbulbifer TaxID=2619833 RepID=UPI0024ADE7C2|nr:hypothetical protein [Microbulbifer sp. MLAF003]WHI50176.1 hypothetical protein P3339_17240 [Microbulbifer sp. MLAF003]